MMSSNVEDFSRVERLRCPLLSSWNIPTVSAEATCSKTFGSSGTSSKGSGTAASPTRARASETASLIAECILQAQDVHLHEPERLDVVLVVLRDDRALGRPLQRHPARDGVARDDEAAEVGAQVHRAVVELLGEVEEHAPRALVAQRVVRALGVGREHLADLACADPRQVAREAVDLGDGQPHRARHHAHRAARRHRVHRRDHRDVLVAEPPVDEVDDLVSAGRVEVDVDVGHLAACRDSGTARRAGRSGSGSASVIPSA